MRLSITGFIVLLALMSSLGSSQQQKSQPEAAINLLSRKIAWREPESTEADIVLVSDLEVAQIPGGMFRMRKCGDVEPKMVPAKQSTFQEELQRIAELKSDYQWTIDDGVFNFFPKFFEPSPLDIPITEFKVENEPAEPAYGQLLDRADVKTGLMRLGLHEPVMQVIVGGFAAPPNLDGTSAPAKEPKRVTLDLKNVTLRQAANAIVRADGQKTWVFSVVLCKGDNTYSSQLVN